MRFLSLKARLVRARYAAGDASARQRAPPSRAARQARRAALDASSRARGRSSIPDDEDDEDDEDEDERSDRAAHAQSRAPQRRRQGSKRRLSAAAARRCWPRRSQPTASRSTESDPGERRRARKRARAISACAARSSMSRPGPVVTLYELEPAPGIKSSRVIGLADDIARSMSAIVRARRRRARPQRHRHRTAQREARDGLSARAARQPTTSRRPRRKLPLCLGKTIGGEPVIADLARMPHLLIAGTTGSGKSVAINTMILSLLYRLTPEQCRLIMIDPKMLELSVYDGIPHLLTPVVTDPKKAVVALKWAVREMEERYRKMSKLGVRNIDGYNARVAEAKAKGEALTRTVQTGFDQETGEAIYEEEELDLEPLPYIVVIVDEMADLMMVAGKDIEGAIQRLAQMARAAGIHVIMATQRPSVDVITGTIKANFPTRISFQVTSKIDSRTILGEQGAEQLLGQGDMLYMAGGGRISRVHGPFVSDDEVEKVVAPPEDAGRAAIPRRRHRRRRRGATRTAPVFDGTGDGRPAMPTTSTTRRSRSCCATARPRPATSSAGCRSATTAPPRSWSGWRRKASSARPTMPASAKSWSAPGGTRQVLR